MTINQNFTLDTTAWQKGYDFNVTCTNVNATSSFLKTNIFIDTVPPELSISALSPFTNNSVFFRHVDTINASILFTDANLFYVNRTVRRLNPDGSINRTINNTAVNVAGNTAYTINFTVDPYYDWNYTNGRYEIYAEAWDSHTAGGVRPLSYWLANDSIVADGDIVIGANDMKEYNNQGEPVTYFYLAEDRYKMQVTYDDQAMSHTMTISTGGNLYYIPPETSGYMGHFVVWRENGQHRWVDFMGDNVAGVIVTKNTANNYSLTIYHHTLTDEILLESIGDLNNNTASYKFNITDGFTIFARDYFTNLTVTNISVTVRNASGYSQTRATVTGNNVTFNMSSGDYTTNMTAGGYAFNSTGNITFSIGGNYTYYLFATNSLYLFFYDEETDALITGINVSIDFLGPSSATTYTTDTGSKFVSGFTTGSYEIRYTAPGYRTRSYFAVITESTTQQITLYDVLNTSSSLTVFGIYDEKGNPIYNATLKAKRFFVADNAYLLVSMEKTDSNGEAGLYLVPYDVYYQFDIEYKGNVVFRGTAQKIYASNVYLRVPLLAEVLYSLNTVRDSVTTNLSYSNDTKVFSYYFNDPTGLVLTGCIDVIKRTSSSDTIYGPTCASSNSGTVTYNISSIYRNNTHYIARGYIDTNTTNSEYYTDIMDIFEFANLDRFGKSGLFLAYIFIIAMFFVGLPFNFSVALVYSILSMIAVQIIGIAFMGWAFIITVTVIGFIVAVVNRI